MPQLQLFHINYFTNFIIRDAVKSIAKPSVYSASEMAMESMVVHPLDPELIMMNKNLSHNKWNGRTVYDRSAGEWAKI